MTRPKTKILVDGGDPEKTRQVKELLGFVDGQTTNPSLSSKELHHTPFGTTQQFLYCYCRLN